MAIFILENNKPIPSSKVEHLPSDTLFFCPECNGGELKSGEAREVWKRGARQQDRWCLDCGHRWVTVLPPRFQAELIPFTTQRQ